MRDLYHDIKVTQVLDPASQTASVNTTSIDTALHESAVFLVSVGESGDTLSSTVKWSFALEESSNDSSWSAAAAGDVENAFTDIDAAAEDDVVQMVGYKGNLRYARVAITKTGTHTNGTPIGVLAVQSHSRHKPATAG